MKYVNDTEERVKRVLDELKREGNINIYRVDMIVYLPKTESGKKLARGLVKARLITLSPYAAFFFALAILYIASPYLIQKEIITIPLESFRGTLVLVVIVGLPLAYVLQEFWRRFIRWKESESFTLFFSLVSKAILIIIGLLLFCYFIGFTITGELLVGIISVSITAIGILLHVQSQRKKKLNF